VSALCADTLGPQARCYTTGGFQVRRGDQNDGGFCGGFHFVGDEKFAAYLDIRHRFSSPSASTRRDRVAILDGP
jgi:hypothetical protein